MLFILSTNIIYVGQKLKIKNSNTTTQNTSTGSFSNLDHQIKNFIKSRSGTISVSVYDKTKNEWYHYNENRTDNMNSTVKIYLLAAMLYDAQKQNRPLTAYEKNLAAKMIKYSHNDSTTKLWRYQGGLNKTKKMINDLNLTQTKAKYAWGTTQTTTHDQAKFMYNVVYNPKFLTQKNRKYLLSLMKNVTPRQKWGVSSGSPSYLVSLKNGWFPVGYSYSNWRLNSTGYVSGKHNNYVISVMTHHNPSFSYGVNTIEGISRIISKHY